MNSIEKIIGYKFNNEKLLERALTHTSYAHEHGVDSYERLEYVGDALADFIVGEYLYQNFDVDAGLLSKYRAKLVSTETFANIIKSNRIDNYIRVGKSVKVVSDSIKADVFESILASVYFDGGINEARSIVERMLLVDKKHVAKHVADHIDYKTTLQETLQAMTPQRSFRFEILEEVGKNNQKIFTVALYVDDKKVAEATGKSHKECEQNCAKQYLSKAK